MAARIFCFAVGVDIVTAAARPSRIFMISPICGLAIGVEPWLCLPAVCIGAIAELTHTRACVRLRDIIMAIAIYRVVYRALEGQVQA